jgi:putative transcriptional regulator
MINNIREKRQELALTQQDLARLVGVSRQTINAIETGKFDPSLSLAFKLSTVFKEPVEALFTPTQTNPS